MSRSEVLRTNIFETNSPPVGHSLNQRNIRESLDGQNRLDTQRNLHITQRKKEKLLKEIQEHQSAKIARIIKRVQSALDGHDGTNFQTLACEMNYLKLNSVCLKSIMSRESKPTMQPI